MNRLFSFLFAGKCEARACAFSAARIGSLVVALVGAGMMLSGFVRASDLGMLMRFWGGGIMVFGFLGYWGLRLRSLNKALFESEREKTVILSNLPGMAYRCRFDRDWTMEFVSDGCKHLTGVESRDLLFNRKISYQRLIHPEDVEAVWEHWQRSSRTPDQPVWFEYRLLLFDQSVKWVSEHSVFLSDEEGRILAVEGLILDTTEKKILEMQQDQVVGELQKSLAEIRTLRGIVPICASCKKIRDDADFWNQVDSYIAKHTHAEFSHGICPECMKALYPEVPDNPERNLAVSDARD